MWTVDHDFFSGKHEKDFYTMMLIAVFSRLLQMNVNTNADDEMAFCFN